MSHEPFDTEAAAYALGALDGEDLARFEAHLAAGCERCEAALRESGEVMAALAREAPPAAPPADVREALVRQLAPTTPARRPHPILPAPSWSRLAAVMAAAMVVAGVVVGLAVSRHYEARLTAARVEAEGLRAEIARQSAVLETHRANLAMADLMRDPITRVVDLLGSGPSPEAEARAVWHPVSGGWLVVTRLAPADPGKVYEAWTISGGQPRPAGVFQVDARGRALHRVAPVDQPVEAFAVTLEPAGGVPAPTGPIVLASR